MLKKQIYVSIFYWRKIYFKLVSKDMERNDPIFKTAIQYPYNILLTAFCEVKKLPHNWLVTYWDFLSSVATRACVV